MKKLLGAAASVCLLIAGATAVHAADTLKWSSFLPATTVSNAKSTPEFISKLEKDSDGNLKVEFYPGGSLVSGGDVQLKIVEDGLADIAEVAVPYTPGRIVGLDVFELPNLAQSNSDGSMASLKLIDEGLVTGLDNMVALGVLQAGPYLIHTIEEISSVRDLRGKKLRVSGQTQAEIVSRLGAVPVSNIPANALAENASRGLIDGALVDMGNLYNFGVGDIFKYHVTNLPLGSFTVMWPMMKERYEGLSDESKAALDDARGEWFTTVLGKNMDQQTKEVTAKLKESGDHVFVELNEEELARANKILDQVVANYLKRDPKNQARLDAAKAALAQ